MAAKKEPRQAKSGGKMLIIILVVLLVGALGAIGWLVMQQRKHAAAEAEHPEAAAAPAVVKAKDPLYLALDPAFVVNFKDQGSMRFLQIGVQLMSHEQAALDAAKANEPAVRDALILLFSGQDANELIAREGKDKLRTDALAEVQRIVSGQLGRPGIDAVYFTAFVMQ